MKRRIITLTVVLLLLIGLYMELTRFAPNRVSIRFETVESERVPASFNNVSVALISDVYGNTDNLRKVIAHLRTYQPDIVIFAGNLYDDTIEAETVALTHSLLNEIPDRLGKFAVLGDHDAEQARESLIASGFRIIDNTRLSIHNQGNESIELIGLGVSPNYPASDSADFTLTVSHNPDVIDGLNTIPIDLMLAGKSMLGQVRIPLIGPVLPSPKHSNRRETVDTALLIQSAGVGHPNPPIRLFTNPDVTIIRLKTLSQ